MFLSVDDGIYTLAGGEKRCDFNNTTRCPLQTVTPSLLNRVLTLSLDSFFPQWQTQIITWEKEDCSTQLTYQYSGTPPYDHLVNTVIVLLRPPFFVLAKRPYIFSWENPVNAATPLIRPTATFWIVLFNFTPFIRPLKLVCSSFHR